MKSVVNSAHRSPRVHIRVTSWLALTLAMCIDAHAGDGPSVQAQTPTMDPIAIMRARGCTACHIIPGIAEARGTMGPTLKGLSERKRIVARTLTNNDKNMRRWLKNPKGVKSDTMMPNVGLSDDEIETLIAHFRSL